MISASSLSVRVISVEACFEGCFQVCWLSLPRSIGQFGRLQFLECLMLIFLIISRIWQLWLCNVRWIMADLKDLQVMQFMYVHFWWCCRIDSNWSSSISWKIAFSSGVGMQVKYVLVFVLRDGASSEDTGWGGFRCGQKACSISIAILFVCK